MDIPVVAVIEKKTGETKFLPLLGNMTDQC